jgi:hypothetical protein
LDPAKTPEKPVRPKRLPIMAGLLVAAFLIPAATVIGIRFLTSSIGSEVEVREMLPLKIRVLGTIPPIMSRADLLRGRAIAVQTFVVSVIACTALVIFLLKVRPIL